MDKIKVLLVDSHWGVYAWQNLADRYPLYVGDSKSPFEDYLRLNMPDESLQTVFSPDNEHWCDNIDYIDQLFIQDDAGVFWEVQQDADIWAINPLAEWSDEIDDYFIPN